MTIVSLSDYLSAKQALDRRYSWLRTRESHPVSPDTSVTVDGYQILCSKSDDPPGVGELISIKQAVTAIDEYAKLSHKLLEALAQAHQRNTYALEKLDEFIKFLESDEKPVTASALRRAVSRLRLIRKHFIQTCFPIAVTQLLYGKKKTL